MNAGGLPTGSTLTTMQEGTGRADSKIEFWFERPRCKATASSWSSLATDFNTIIGS